MTRRERLERKLGSRQEWAEKRDRKANAAFGRARSIADNIPLGQPILVGHHSERHARRDRERIDNSMRAGVESTQMAEYHRSKAGGIADALGRSIYSDDDNAIEALEARIAENEAKRERMKRVNSLYRKGDAAGIAALGLDLEKLRRQVAAVGLSWVKVPYTTDSETRAIATDRKRIEHLKVQAKRQAAAESAPDGILVTTCPLPGGDSYTTVRFAEYPGREATAELKAAGYSWGSGQWCGSTENLPERYRTPAAN